ncbi:MAG: hypothetical protein V9G12_10205 [Microthrixaceae bacterium]
MGSHQLRRLVVGSVLVTLIGCIPDGGSPPLPTTTSVTTTVTPTTVVVGAAVSGYERPTDTGAALPGGGAIVVVHVPSAGSGPGIGGPWPVWQYTGTSISTISANPAVGSVPGAPPFRDFLSSYGPGWSRVATGAGGSGSTFPIEIHTVSPFVPMSPTPLGTLSPTSSSGAFISRSWSPDGRYLAVVADPVGASSTDLFVFDTIGFTEVRHATFAASPSLSDLYPARTAWTTDSAEILVGTSSGIRSFALSGPGGDSSAPWPVAKPCGVSDVSTGGRVAIVCRNGVGSDSLFNLYTQERDGSDARLVITPTLVRPIGTPAAGISPEAFFSPDGNFLAVNLNTWPGLTDTRGGLAVVADEPLATPVLLTIPTSGTPAGAATGGDAPIGWIAAPLQP